MYKTYGSESGFDVTTLSTGTITLLDNIAITTDGNTPTVDEYTVTLTFVNLDANQNNNSNKVFDAQVIMGDGTSDDNEESVTGLGAFGIAILSNYGESIEEIEGKKDPDFVYGTEVGIYATEDNYGTTYYYRGAVDNNWIKYGQENGEDIWWRIMRINGDGTIRIIYSGTTAPTLEESNVMTGSKTSINEVANFNDNAYSAEYLGYMYTLGENHGISTSSTIKGVIDNWYETNLSSYSESISQNTSFCYNRTAYSDRYGDDLSSGTGTTYQYFKSAVNMLNYNKPTLHCDNINDYYTVGEADNGNKALIYPIGLASADEVIIAGLAYSSSNSNNYLNSGTRYWLGSPFSYGSNASMFYVTQYSNFVNYLVSETLEVRPVISLKNNINTTGSGTYNDPYVVVS